MGVSKRFSLSTLEDQPQALQFRADNFNLTNSVHFDPNTANLIILSPSLFGKYTNVLVKPRVFQFS
jgi:hypothetical protein